MKLPMEVLLQMSLNLNIKKERYLKNMPIAIKEKNINNDFKRS